MRTALPTEGAGCKRTPMSDSALEASGSQGASAERQQQSGPRGFDEMPTAWQREKIFLRPGRAAAESMRERLGRSPQERVSQRATSSGLA